MYRILRKVNAEMCGICGIVSLAGAEVGAAGISYVRAMVSALAHRGPDDSSVVSSGRSALGVTRLAIRGIHDGTQPMLDAQSGVVAVCNGEIDNHRELRRWLASQGRLVAQATDVAVIPGLYLELGEAFVDQLVGVFAIAVWDPRRAHLLLARDRAGERCLFYTAQGDYLRFATEISALSLDRTLRLTPSGAALAEYLQNGCFVAPASPFEEVHKVAPAEVVAVDAGGCHRRSYWHWNITTAAKTEPSTEAFDSVFRGAVQRQSDVDVECGVFLSGGLDSSLVAAVAKLLRPERNLKGYTIRFREGSYDEGDYAARVADLLGIELTTVLVEPDTFPAEITRIVRLVGEPLADQSWIPTALLSRRAAREVKLALVGEGADELFGGYPTYLGARLGERYSLLPRWFRQGFRWLVRRWPPSDKKVSLSFLLKRFVEGWDLDGVSRHLLWTANVHPEILRRLGVEGPAPRPAKGMPVQLLDAIQELDLEATLAEGLLMEKDRGSMSSALELRAPFLDKAVLEFAATLPVCERVRGLQTKAFLKHYALRYLPGWVVHRKKRGLSVPLGAWLREPLRDWARSRLSSGLLDGVGVRSQAAVELLEEHCRRAADHGRSLWTLIVLSEWLEWVSAPDPCPEP